VKEPKVKTMSLLGCTTDAHALLVLPKGFVDKRVAHMSVVDGPENRNCLWSCRVRAKKGLDRGGNVSWSPYPAQLALELSFECGTTVESKIFGVTEEWRNIEVGDAITFTAELSQKPWGLSFSKIQLADWTGCVHPVYVGVPGKISGDLIEGYIERSIADPANIRRAVEMIMGVVVVRDSIKARGMTPVGLLRGLHRPDTPETGDRALSVAKAASVEEVKWSARFGTGPAIAAVHNIDASLVSMVAAQAEQLSPGQRHALNVIRKAVNRNLSAKILLNGDVGSGKTLVFMLAAASVSETYAQRVAIMVPSEIVANQIYAQAVKRFPGLKPVLLTTGSQQTLGDSMMVIGTQSLLHRSDLGPLAMVVIDEQHKFSVDQRKALVGTETHVIEASATPIPRSLALALFDGWREAKIAGYPVDKTINCHLLLAESKFVATQIVHKHMANGKRVIFLYPQVESKTQDEKSVLQIAQKLEERFPGQVVSLHGRLKPEPKAQALSAFASGEKPIAVSSTVIEVGVDIPDIGCMVVNGAERFGVAQLHQLRGRLVRNGGVADFVMMTNKPPANGTRERLESVRDILDGFELAERDMHLRGFGEVLGEMQAGSTDTLFKLARLEVGDFFDQQKNTP
jgi:ATP-dependent DNA helicase RecG